MTLRLLLFVMLVVGIGVWEMNIVRTFGQQRLPSSLQERHARETKRSVNYAESWQEYHEGGRTAYVYGFMEGQLNGVLDATAYFDGKCEPRVVNGYQDTPWDFAGVSVGIVMDVMTDLYRDRANSLVPFSQILYIAREKIMGKPIEELLLAARRRAVGK